MTVKKYYDLCIFYNGEGWTPFRKDWCSSVDIKFHNTYSDAEKVWFHKNIDFETADKFIEKYKNYFKDKVNEI